MSMESANMTSSIDSGFPISYNLHVIYSQVVFEETLYSLYYNSSS